MLDRGALRVTSLHDADTPIVHEGMVPLFTLDVWEHAYYIDYRNERPRFASSVLTNIVNWDFVAQNLDGEGFERANQAGARSPNSPKLQRHRLLLEAVAGAEDPADRGHAGNDDQPTMTAMLAQTGTSAIAIEGPAEAADQVDDRIEQGDRPPRLAQLLIE